MKRKATRILVIGGAGYVGTALCARLVERGDVVGVYDNVQSENSINARDGVKVYRADIREFEQLRETIKHFQPEKIILLAALHFIPYCVEHPEETFAVNVLGLQNVLDAVRETNPNIDLVFSSSAAVYKDSDHALAETSDIESIDIYGMTKVLGERLIRAQSKKYKIVRLFNVYGAHDPHPHVIPRIYAELKSNTPQLEIGDTTPERDFIHVSEVASGIIAVMDLGKNKNIYNIGTGHAISVKQVLNELMRQCNHTPVLKERVQAYNRKTDRMVLKADISKITAHTGWRPSIFFKDGIRTLR